MSVVLFSAGEKEYVYSIVDQLLLPILDGNFYFDAIYTRQNLDRNGIKRMDILKRDLQVDDVLFVDDLEDHCIQGATPYGVSWVCIKPFDADSEDADDDKELVDMLKHPFFYWSTARIGG